MHLLRYLVRFFVALPFAIGVPLYGEAPGDKATLTRGVVEDSADGDSNAAEQENKVFHRFLHKVFPLLHHPEKGCVECHQIQGNSNLVLSGKPLEDFRLLMDEQYFNAKGVDTLLSRVADAHEDRRMPKDGQAWSSKDIRRLKSFLESVQEMETANGLAADEQFPRSLLAKYTGEPPAAGENLFLSYWQLKSKVRVLFEDDWVREGRDLFAENLALFGGADFKTRFNESNQPSATFLTALEMLARDVSSQAYENRVGPFRDWPVLKEKPDLGKPPTDAYRMAIDLLYRRILFRPPTETEVAEAYQLLCGVFALEETIRQRDDELAFELTVRESHGNRAATQRIRIPVSGDPLQVRQILLDQRRSKSQEAGGGERKVVIKDLFLEPNVPGQRMVLHNRGTSRNVSFAGIELLDKEGLLVEAIHMDSPKIEVEGAWQISEEDDWKSYEDRGQHKGMSSISVRLEPPRSGKYQVAVLFRPDPRNAAEVCLEFFAKRAGNRLALPSPLRIPPRGEAHFAFDCSNDADPFARLPASFRFSESSSIEVSNRGTFDTVTAGAVELVDSQDADRSCLIDSLEADGNERWKRFDEGRFKAYNVKGAKLHDANGEKGELSLTYRPASKKDQGWDEQTSYDVRIYYPGKRDQECQVPVIVRAAESSPILQIRYPSLAKADAKLRLDATACYNVSHSKLEYQWRQLAGTRVEVAELDRPILEFIVPRRQVDQAAWSALAAALMRHPDFLFTRPPSLQTVEDPAVRNRLMLMKIALDLVGRPPLDDEIRDLDRGVSLAAMVDRYLDSEDFRRFYFHRVRLTLESQGTVSQDEPVRIWCYVAFQDRPLQEILTADYTVDESMTKQSRPAYHGKTGILTTPGFIQGKPGLPHYNYAAQVSMLFLGFVYEVPADIVDQREGVTALGTTDPSSVCYSCHKILTPLAFQRLQWTDEGVFRTTNEDGLPIDASDQNASPDYPFPGEGMEAFATQAVRKERFLRTMINTHVHYYFGRPLRFREDERVLYKRLWDSVQASNFSIRQLIRDIVASPEYWTH